MNQSAQSSENNETNVRSNNERAHSSSTLKRRRSAVISGLSAALPGCFADYALARFTTPRRFARPAIEVDWLKGATPSELLPGVRAWQWGSGPTVLLVHGWEGRGAQLGAFVAPLVAAGFAVTTFDAPGHGDSSGKQASVADFALVIAAVERCHGELHGVIAHSFGGPAASLAVQRGVRANALAYVSSPADLNFDTARLEESIGVSSRAIDSMKRCLTRRVGVTFEQLDVAHYGPTMSLPLYVVHDVKDRDVSQLAAQNYCQHWPGAVGRFTSGLGHRRILKDPEVIQDVVEYIGSVQRPNRPSELTSWLASVNA